MPLKQITAKQILDQLRSGVIPERTILHQLALDAADDRAKTSELFQDLIEPLSDSFEPAACHHYVAIFSEIIHALIPSFDAAALRELYERHASTASHDSPTGRHPAQVFVLSRVTLGADIAVTSVFLDAAKKAFPSAQITFVGNRKNAELWAADLRIQFQEAPYDRTGTLRGRLETHRGLTDLLDAANSIVLDPDSRLTQLGLLPVCPAENYYFFESRTAGASTQLSLSQLATQWCAHQFGVQAQPYIAASTTTDDARVTVSFGVGENPAKRVSEAFEITVLQQLVRLGAKVLVDQGAGGEEAERVQLAVRQTAGVKGQVEMFRGPFAAFAARIARSPLYVGYDSAGQHAAAALGIPSLTVFAGYPNEKFLQRWRPSGPVSEVLLADEPNLLTQVEAHLTQLLPPATHPH